nr:hypothetical protein [Massilia mucilaginosa]
MLVALMLSGMRMSIQAELDTFFGHLAGQAQLLRVVSEQAFAQARAKLSLTAIPLLNDWLVNRAELHGFVPRWHGLRLVAADASTVRFGVRATRRAHAAPPDQILFGLFLPGAELMVATSLHGIEECGERQALVQHLDRLSSDDSLLLYRAIRRAGSLPCSMSVPFHSACGWKKLATAASPACRRFCAPVLMSRLSRSVHHRSAMPPIASSPARHSRFSWCATSHRTAKCVC